MFAFCFGYHEDERNDFNGRYFHIFSLKSKQCSNAPFHPIHKVDGHRRNWKLEPWESLGRYGRQVSDDGHSGA